MWYVVDEFGFVTGEGFRTEEEAKESCNVWNTLAISIQWGIEYHIEKRD